LHSRRSLLNLRKTCNFPEGPAWDGKGSLYLSSCYGGYIYKISGDTQEKFVDSLSSLIKQTNGLTFGKDGNLYACDYGRGNILRISPSKRVEIISDGFEGKRYNRPNDLAFFSDGSLYFTDPKSYGADKPDGRLFRLDVISGEAEL
jgi:gluconolactonase